MNSNPYVIGLPRTYGFWGRRRGLGGGEGGVLGAEFVNEAIVSAHDALSNGILGRAVWERRGEKNAAFSGLPVAWTFHSQA